MITIDGGFGEGGGQILRTSLALSALTGREVTIENIRAGREKPGLRPQHLTAALAVADICRAEISGVDVGSRKLVFKPRKIEPGNYEFDVSRIRASAGAVNLVFQTVLWPLAFSGRKCRVTFKGGTHVPHAPTSNYISETFLPAVAEMGLICDYSLIKAGYYPEGGGETRVEIRPVDELKPLHMMERSEPLNVEVLSAVSNLPRSIAERQMNTGLERLRAMGLQSDNSIRQYQSRGKGTVFFISTDSSTSRAGFQSLGELKKRAEKVADEACDELEAYLRTGAALDKHLADQLIIPIALADGKSKFTTSEITLHLITNIAVVEKFLDVHFHISRGLGEPGTIERVDT